MRQIVRLDDAVAVVVDHMWAAKHGLKPGVTARKQGDARRALAGRREEGLRRSTRRRSSPTLRWSR